MRLEVGSMLANDQVSLVRRDHPQRQLVSCESAAAASTAAVDAVQVALYEQAAAMQARLIVDVPDIKTAIDAAREGFARLPWRACSGDGEHRLNAAGVSIRCVTTTEGVPDTLDTEDLVAIAARAY